MIGPVLNLMYYSFYEIIVARNRKKSVGQKKQKTNVTFKIHISQSSKQRGRDDVFDGPSSRLRKRRYEDDDVIYISSKGKSGSEKYGLRCSSRHKRYPIDDSDTDFHKSPKKICKKGKSTKFSSKFKSDGDKGQLKLQTRSSPKSLQKAVVSLNEKQKEAVRAMGLGGLLCLQVSSLPMKLAYFVVDHLDPDNCLLRINEWEMEIVEEDVHYVLGLPLGGDIFRQGKRLRRSSNEFLNRFRRCAGGGANGVKCSHIIDRIKVMDEDDDDFKLLFLVLFFSTMVESQENGRCNERILDSIKSIESIPKLNWCEYILHSLMVNTRKWKSDKSGYFVGPLTFILVCVI